MIKPDTQVQHAEMKLRQLILDMKIRPGERMTERHIEGVLGVSRTSIRTALFHLENEGLVTHKHRGWIVSPIDLEELSQLCVYRKVLEVSALQMMTAITIQPHLVHAEQLLMSVTDMTDGEHLDHVGCQFHLWTARLSHNCFIVQGVENATLRLRRARWLAGKHHDHQEWQERHQLVNALKEGDMTHAMSMLDHHLTHKRQVLLSTLEEKQRILKEQGALLSLLKE